MPPARRRTLRGRPASLAAAVAKRGAVVAHVGLFDLDGGLRSRRVAVAGLDAVAGPAGTFCNVLHQWDVADAVWGPGPFVGEAIAVDMAALRRWPFEPDAALLIADYDGPLAASSPRRLLGRQIDRAAAMGFALCAAFEFEWLVYEETAASLRAKRWQGLTPWAPDNRCWDAAGAAGHAEIVRDLDALLASGDVAMHGLGMELGAGCMEGTLAATDAARAADDAALFKLYTRAFFRRRGHSACFMAQPDRDAPGLSGHIHLSLTDRRGRPLFHDSRAPSEPSPMMRRFVAGVLTLLPELIAMPLHTVNAYRRLAPGNWAPRTATWGVQTIRRVSAPSPATRPPRESSSASPAPTSIRISALPCCWRPGCQASSGNSNLRPWSPAMGEPSRRRVRGRCRDLLAAADALAGSAAARALFGDDFVDRFAASRRHEFDALRRAVSAPEKARYFEAV